MVARFQF